jgi:hypothetical protein
MNNDTKTTLTGIVTGILTLLTQLNILHLSPDTVTTLSVTIVTVGMMVLAYFTNKK